MAAAMVLIWLVASVLAYFIIDAVFHCYCPAAWDRQTREYILMCTLLLGPLLFVISLELLILAAISRGLTENHTRRYRDS